MSQGLYGTKIPANINPQTDVDIFYSYRENRSDDDITPNVFNKLSSNYLIQKKITDDENKLDILEGMYDLQLPIEIFNKKGFYSIYIKPKEIKTKILDVGVLITYPDVRGIIIDTSEMSEQYKSSFKENNHLVGYRVIYFDNNERMPYCRIVTSSYTCEPVVQNLTNSNQKSVRYKYNNNSDLVFVTLTPSLAPTYNENSTPYIGKVNQKIAFVNTLFEPILLDIEMVEHDADTISTMLEGSQLRSLDQGLVTTFNDKNEIYHQSEHYTLKNSNAKPIYEVKLNKTNSIDFTQTIVDK